MPEIIHGSFGEMLFIFILDSFVDFLYFLDELLVIDFELIPCCYFALKLVIDFVLEFIKFPFEFIPTHWEG